LDKSFLKHTLRAPEKPKHISKHAQWLAGEGAGSWFVIEVSSEPSCFTISRFSPKGDLECKGVFIQEKDSNAFDIRQHYNFTHLSHCNKVTLEQHKTTFTFIRVEDE
jgi:hypothetical protein